MTERTKKVTTDARRDVPVTLHVVALRYHDVSECLSEFLREAEGRRVTLRPDHANGFDARAVAAYDWQGRLAGYVASDELETCWRALRGSGSAMLTGRVKGVDSEHPCLTLECRVKALGEAAELYPRADFDAWVYTGPLLRNTREQETLDFMSAEVASRLSQRSAWTAEDYDYFAQLTERFCDLSRYDLSSEMSAYRRWLCQELSAMGDERLAPIVAKLRRAGARMGRATHNDGAVVSYWMKVVVGADSRRELLIRRRDYDVDEVERQLEAFPNKMYAEWRGNREQFVAKLLYLHVPRQVLWCLVSGIAFVEALRAEDTSSERSRADNPLAAGSPVYLSGARGQKIDLIRVLNAMYEQGRFVGYNGSRLTKKDFFTAIGITLHIDLSSYDKDLSRSMSDGTKLDRHTRVFEEMRQTMIDLWNSR